MLFHQWGAQNIYIGSIEADEMGAIPLRSTSSPLPELTGAQVAHWTGEGWEVLDSAPTPEPVNVLDLKQHTATTNNAAYEAAIGHLTSDYPAAEINTWERQRAEVVAWDADRAALTPWIDTAAAVRGLDRDEYLARTLAKVNAFAVASAYLTGRRQGIDDQIRAATTAEELAAVVIDYTLPGA